MAEISLNSLQTQVDNKADKSEIPISLPANGGNADTLDGKHFSDIQALVGSGFDLGHSFAQNGYQKLSNGLIIQWGRVGNNFSNPVTFPIAFPNDCFSCVTSVNLNGIGGGAERGASYITTVGFTASYTNVGMTYIAIGN